MTVEMEFTRRPYGGAQSTDIMEVRIVGVCNESSDNYISTSRISLRSSLPNRSQPCADCGGR